MKCRLIVKLTVLTVMGVSSVCASSATQTLYAQPAAEPEVADPSSAVAANNASADPQAPDDKLVLDFASYLHQVGLGNLDLVAQRASVSIARAEIDVARTFPDPSLQVGIGQYDASQKGNPTISYIGLNVPVQLGGKRGARIDYAQAQRTAAAADLQDFLRGLRAQAADAFIESTRTRSILERRQRSLSNLERLVSVNEERLKAGDIGEAALLQSRVEASQFKADVISAQGDVRAADLTLVSLLGKASEDAARRSLELVGDLRKTADRQFDAHALLQTAIQARPDLQAAQRRLEAARRQVDLAKANRWVDVDLNVNWQHNFPVHGDHPLPPAEWLGGSVTVPLPLSNIYRGELNVARATRVQSEAQADAALVRVRTEVQIATTQYNAASARVEMYTEDVLTTAERVLEMALYNYQRGGATLVEVLVAQRTDNDVHIAFYNSLAELAHALVAVEQAASIWDIDL